MIEYMENHPKGVLIYQNRIIIIEHKTLMKKIEELCIEHLFTYTGYRKAIASMFGFHHLVPIYFCEDIQLIPTKRYRDYDNIWINFAQIKEYQYVGTCLKIVFFSGLVCNSNVSLVQFENQIKKLAIIRNTKVKHFH